MKKTNFILAFAFNMILGIVLMGVAFNLPILGLAFGFLAYLPLPTGVFGENIVSGSDVTDKDKEILEKIQQKIDSAMKEFQRGLINEEGLKLRLAPIEEKLKEVNSSEKTSQIEKAIDELSLRIAGISNQKQEIVFESREKAIQKATEELLEDKDYQRWVDNGCKGKCPTSIEVKYSITSSRTGNVSITNQSGVVSDPYSIRPLHIRDLIPVLETDQPYLVHDVVTSFDNPALGLSETADALEVTMTTSETTTSYKRIAIFMDITKTALKGVKWLRGHIMSRLPEKIKNHEDFQLLFGDGAGANVDGLFKNATLLNLDGPSFVAGTIASVASYQAGAKALITFTNDHNLNNGMIITFALFTSGGYNTSFPVNVMTSKSIILDIAYVADAVVSDVTATTKYGLKNAINLATEIDCLNAAKSVMRVGEYQVTGHVINPQDSAIIEGLKDTTGRYNDSKIERINGVLFIDRIPCVETNAMKQGWFMSADFRNIAELLEFIGMSISFIEDTSYAKANKVMLIAEEQIVFPIYNKFLATYGNFATVKAALETA